jgi:hypothetical protein
MQLHFHVRVILIDHQMIIKDKLIGKLSRVKAPMSLVGAYMS